jgi:cob(I)alamin adenosyltransferase
MDKNTKHKQRMQNLKQQVDKGIAEATEQRGLCVLLTGDGKGKSSSAFGMLLRSLGYGHKVY